MKYILPAATAILLMASCADEFNTDFPVERPVDLEKLAELADYKPLKENINREAHPGFKLGAALAADEFSKKLTVYNVGVTNFDEIVAGNAMKYASVVDDKGNMNFSTVSTFVNDAIEAGLTVYGHTLAWHSQQRPKYLNSLIADKPKPVDPNETGGTKQVQDYTINYQETSSFPFYVMGYTPEFSAENGLISVYPGSWYQYFAADGIPTDPEIGTYYVECEIRGEEEGSFGANMGWGWGDGEQVSSRIKFGTEWAKTVAKFDGVAGTSCNVVFQPGGLETTVYVRNLRVYHEVATGNGSVEYKDVWTPQELQLIARDATHADTDAEVIAGGGPNGLDAVKITGKTNPAEEWDTQFFVYTPNYKWEAGAKYRFHMWYKANKAIGTDSQVHGTPGGYIHWQMLSPNPSFTTDWQEKTWEATTPAEGGGNQQSIAFNLNKNKSSDPGTVYEYYFAGITWESYSQIEVPKVEIVRTDYVNNSDMEGSEASNFCIKENNGAFKYEITDGVGVNGSRGIKLTSNAGAEQDWDTQFWIVMNEGQWLQEGDVVNVSFDYKASTSASADTQAHGAPGSYQHWACVGSPSFTTEWQTYSKVLTVDASMAGGSGLGSIAFNLSKDKTQNITYYFDNIKVWSEVEQEVKSTIPLTDEEKHDTLVYAMDKWIAGMMDACAGNVKAWDVVNEAISGGGDDGEGNYALQHGTEGNTTDFFWQDHMGDLEYVRQAVRLARKYYPVSMEGGDDGQLKLFVNDYNLESDWDGNKKVKSLINWIKKWEADGVTKIDGIGSQMHISYYEDAKTLESKKNAIVESFKLMAASGKLVRISELDMGYVKADGTDAKLDDMTNEMEQKMEEYYQWIIEQYFANVPAAQQYGITQWCLTDSQAGSGWRADTPVGIWDLNWNRKYVYRGWVNGLSK